MTAQADVGRQARQHARWHWSEVAFWILALSCAFLFPSRYLIMTAGLLWIFPGQYSHIAG